MTSAVYFFARKSVLILAQSAGLSKSHFAPLLMSISSMVCDGLGPSCFDNDMILAK